MMLLQRNIRYFANSVQNILFCSQLSCKHLVLKQNNYLPTIYELKIHYCQEASNPEVCDKNLPNHGNVNSENCLNKNNGKDYSWQSNQPEEEELQSNILGAALSYVPIHGWSTDAISKGAESLGYSSMIHGMFSNGATDLVNYFYVDCNAKLEKELKKLTKEQDEKKRELSSTQFIRQAVELRLRMNVDYIESWPQALAIHMHPSNALSALHNIGTLMDIIWYYAGDRSIDFNWYTKRGVLATVYKGTELCMLQDKSADFQDTWAFLDRRLEEVRTFAKVIRQAGDVSKDIGSVGQVGLITALNILGLNMKAR